MVYQTFIFVSHLCRFINLRNTPILSDGYCETTHPLEKTEFVYRVGTWKATYAEEVHFQARLHQSAKVGGSTWKKEKNNF